MELDLSLALVLLLGLAVFAGSVVQGSAGFGVSLIGVPVMTLLDPTLMPGAMLVVGTMLPVFTLAREGRHTERRAAGLMLLGRLLGTAGGVWVISVLSSQWLAIGIGVLVLLGVALSVNRVEVPMTPKSLFGAGAITGVTGTAASISGPVVGIVMQRMPGGPMRATMALFFSIGTVFSLGGLALSGHLTVRQVAIGGLMLPFLAVGYLLSEPFRRYLDRGWTRPAVLALSACSAVVVLMKALFWE